MTDGPVTVPVIMTTDEFRPLAVLLQTRWFAFEFPKSALERYFEDLKYLDAGDVRVALEAFGDEVRAPSSGRICRKVIELRLGLPGWPEARAAISRWRAGSDQRAERAMALECDLCDDGGWILEGHDARPCDCRAERAAVRRGLSELPESVADFVAGEGWLSYPEIDAMLDGNTTMDAQVRKRWEHWVRQIIEGQVLGALPAGVGDDMPAVRAARSGGELRQIDPTRLLTRG